MKNFFLRTQSFLITLFLSIAFIFTIATRLPTQELYNIKKLLLTDGIKAYSFFSILFLILFVCIVVLIILLNIFIKFFTVKIFRIKFKLEKIRIVINSFLVLLGFSIIFQSLFSFTDNTLLNFLMDPFALVNCLVCFVVMRQSFSKLGIEHIIYISSLVLH